MFRKCIFVTLILCPILSYGQSNYCSDIFTNKKNINRSFLSTVRNNLGLQALYKQTIGKIVESRQKKSVVPVSKQIQDFRDKYLPLLKMNDLYRESFIRYMEASMRIKSSFLKKSLENRTFINYDFVVIGSGVHGVVAVNSLLRENPNYKVLIIDKNDTGGATFRQSGETFRINSSNRASGPLPLPGRGNINELPALPIQVSDISSSKYPSAGNLGDVLVAGLYAAVTQYANVDVLFRTKATETRLGDGKFPVRLKAEFDESTVEVRAQKLINSTGLGSPKIPREVMDNLLEAPKLTKIPRSRSRLARVMTFEDVMRILSQDPNPRRFFEKKKVGVVGTGDSANVLIEFLLGYAPRLGYGLSDAQTAGAKRIFWIGQKQKTCEEFISDARSRYAQIGTGFRSSDPDKRAPLVGVPSRLMGVFPESGMGKRRVVAKFEDGSGETLDIVILATGYNNRLVDNYRSFIGDKDSNSDLTTKEFLENYTSFLEAKTRVSKNEKVRVATVIPAVKKAKDARIIGVGPGGGKFPRDTELVGIIQNFVSIFNNAPRTEAAVKLITKNVDPLASPNRPVTGSRKISPDLEIRISNFEPIRSLGDYTESYLKFTLMEIFKGAPFKKTSGEFSFDISLVGKELILSSPEGFPNFVQTAKALAFSRDFFNTVRSLFMDTDFKKLSVDVKFGDIKTVGLRFDFEASEIRGEEVINMDNGGVLLTPIIE